MATVADLHYIRKIGFDKTIFNHVENGRPVVGVCGGYQMLGQKMYNPLKTQGDAREIDGLGLLPISTLFGEEMIETTSTANCALLPKEHQIVTGEEHRSGYSWRSNRSKNYCWLNSNPQRIAHKPLPPRNRSLMPGKSWLPGRERYDGMFRRDRLVIGTYLHGLFYEDAFRKTILSIAGIAPT